MSRNALNISIFKPIALAYYGNFISAFSTMYTNDIVSRSRLSIKFHNIHGLQTDNIILLHTINLLQWFIRATSAYVALALMMNIFKLGAHRNHRVFENGWFKRKWKKILTLLCYTNTGIRNALTAGMTPSIMSGIIDR